MVSFDTTYFFYFFSRNEEQDETAQILTMPYSGSFFTLNSAKTTTGSVTYKGQTYTTGILMETATSITFTTTKATTLTIVLNPDKKNNVKIDGTKTTGDGNYVITVQLAAGTHTITKGDVAHIFYMSVE